MDNSSRFSEDGFKDTKTLSLSEKLNFASSGITAFEISDPKNQKRTSRCCIWSALIIYLVMLTGGMGLLAYKVYRMHNVLNNMKEVIPSFEELVSFHANATMENETFLGTNVQKWQENWIHDLKEEVHVIKMNNQYLQWEMANFTDQIKSNNSQGIPGPPGERGIPGRKGDQGDKGEKGDIGLRGIKGEPGTNGTGFSGPKGEPGVPGIRGYPGHPGEKGETGAMGPKGTKGDYGVPGVPGLNGEKGSQGNLGPVGPQGLPGIEGLMGARGLDGLPGPKGEAGERGTMGTRGPTGAPGQKGEQGQQGLQGPQGLPGPQGNKGAAGNLGPPGLRGPKGEQGETGAASKVPGQKGDPGEKGSKGDTGSPGIQGPQGERGISGGSVSLRLIGQNNRGRVEILHQGLWGTICDDYWDLNAGTVVCRMLGFSQAVNIFTASPGSGKIWLDDVKCSGSENSIYLCNKREWGENNCNHSEDAGVECT